MEKKGYTTTELYVTLANILLGIAVMKGYLTPDYAKTLVDAGILNNDTVTIAGAGLSALSGVGYAISRAVTKFGTKHVKKEPVTKKKIPVTTKPQ